MCLLVNINIVTGVYNKYMIEFTEAEKQKVRDEYENWKNNYANNSVEVRKKLGQFFTPPELSIKMFGKFDMTKEEFCEIDILDDSCGTGNLLAAAIMLGANPENCFGVEIDKDIYNICVERLTKLGVPKKQLRLADTFKPTNEKQKVAYESNRQFEEQIGLDTNGKLVYEDLPKEECGFSRLEVEFVNKADHGIYQKKVFDKKFDLIIINPPYKGKKHLKFINNAFHKLKPNGILINLSPVLCFEFPNRKLLPIEPYIQSIEYIHKEDAQKHFNWRNQTNLGIWVIKHNNTNRYIDCFKLRGFNVPLAHMG